MALFKNRFRALIIRIWFILIIVLMGLFTGFNDLTAQRISYQDLLNRTDEPHIYLDHFMLPSSNPDKVGFVTTFRIDYKLLRFKKLSSRSNTTTSKQNKPSFQSNVSISLELFTAKNDMKEGEFKKADFQSLTPVVRNFWKHTVYADTYEQTQSNKHYLSGFINTQVSPGPYRYIVQVNPGGSNDQSTTRSRFVNIQKTGGQKQLPFYYVDSLSPPQKPKEAVIANFGKNVNYGKDFHLLFQLPVENHQNYVLSVHRVKIENKDTTRKESVYTKKLKDDDILASAVPTLSKDSTRLKLSIGYNNEIEKDYGVVQIPNSQFENGKYQILLKNGTSDQILNKDFYQSRWINMPISLLNIDVSIRMLRFIVSDSKLNELQKGSRDERINKFKKFWEEKDPTPNTAFNELMTEYYQRIDHAYEKYSSINQPGFETDMGRIYIRRGPPDSVQRKFPSGRRAVEVWTYPEKTYIFRATSGFGDFELVSEK